MNTSLKMARLDYYAFKPLLAAFTGFIVVVFMLAGITDSSIGGLCFTSSWYVAILSANIFSIQEKNGMERLYASLSLELRNIIKGRYIFIFCNYAFALILSFFIGIVTSVLQNRMIDFADVILGMCSSLFLFVMIVGIQIPIYFRFGYTRAKVWGMIPFIFIVGIMLIDGYFGVFSNIVTGVHKNELASNVVCVAVSFLIVFISYHLSVRCYLKRR